jgi:Ca2+-binding EF-hand superfamily protein
MALFALLFTLGILSGVGITLGINKLAEKSFGGKDRLEQSLKELEVAFKQLDQKYLDLYVEVEQMRTILKNNGFEKDVDIPSILRTLSEIIETLRSNQDFDRRTQTKAIDSLIDDMNRVKKYVTRIASGNEY